MVLYGNPQPAIRLRLHCHRIGLRGQRLRASAGGKGISSRRHRDGAPLGARLVSAHQLVDSSLVLAAETRLARFLQHAFLPPCHHLPRLCRRRWIDHLRQHSASTARQSLGDRLLDWPVQLEIGDAAPLSNRGAHARRNSKPHPRTRRPSSEKSRGSRRMRSHVLPHQRWHLPARRRRTGQQNLCRIHSSAGKVRPAPPARDAAVA